MNAMWEVTDIALPSIDDEMDLHEETAQEVVSRFASRPWKACALKRGEEGPIIPGRSEGELPEFAKAPQIVDTTAAGDSFNAGYLAAFVQGKDEIECLQQGHELARQVVQVPGAIAPR